MAHTAKTLASKKQETMNYHLKIEEKLSDVEIDKIYSSVFRKNHEESGFIILTFEKPMNSKILRKYMVQIKESLCKKCQADFHEKLDFYWLGRFNHQNTTPYHRDNAPKDSFLMLGYEPTKVESKLSFADYHQLITNNNIPVDKYYELYNPLFKKGVELLKPYITEIETFDKEAYKIVLMNNSDLTSKKTCGVLHKAEIPEKDFSQPRILNSIMLYLKPMNQPSIKTKEEEIEFLETNAISE